MRSLKKSLSRNSSTMESFKTSILFKRIDLRLVSLEVYMLWVGFFKQDHPYKIYSSETLLGRWEYQVSGLPVCAEWRSSVQLFDNKTQWRYLFKTVDLDSKKENRNRSCIELSISTSLCNLVDLSIGLRERSSCILQKCSGCGILILLMHYLWI